MNDKGKIRLEHRQFEHLDRFIEDNFKEQDTLAIKVLDHLKKKLYGIRQRWEQDQNDQKNIGCFYQISSSIGKFINNLK